MRVSFVSSSVILHVCAGLHVDNGQSCLKCQLGHKSLLQQHTDACRKARSLQANDNSAGSSSQTLHSILSSVIYEE